MKNKLFSLILTCSFVATASLAQPVDGTDEQAFDGTSLTIAYPTGVVSIQGVHLSCAASFLSANDSFRQPCTASHSQAIYSAGNIPSDQGLSHGEEIRIHDITPVRFDASLVQPRALFDHPGSRIMLHIGKSYLHRITDFDPYHQHSDYRRFSPRNTSDFQYLIGRFRTD